MIKVTLTKCVDYGRGNEEYINEEYISISDIEYENTSGAPIEFEDTWRNVGEGNDGVIDNDEEESRTELIYNFVENN